MELIIIPSNYVLIIGGIILFIMSFASSSLPLVVAKLKKEKKQKQVRQPPGPWKLPLIGSLHHVLLLGDLPHRSLTRLSRKYGPLMHLQLGEVPAVVASSLEMAKVITKTHDLAFANRPKLMVVDLVYYKSTDIAFSPYAEYWRQMRRVCILEMLTRKMVKSFNAIRRDELQKMVSSIKHHVSSSSSSSHPVNLFEKVIWFNSAMTCRSAFGTLIDGDQEKFIGMMREVLTFAGGFELVDMFPSRKWIPYVVGTRSTLLKLHRELDKCYESIIEKHERNLLRDGCKGNNEAGEEDIVDVLLKLKEDEEGRQYRLTRDNIKAIINDLFSAGTETTATAATWAIAEMMRHPNVLVKAQEEVREKLKGKTTFEDDDMEELAYLKLVVKETLRLHPPIPLLLPRESIEEREIEGFVIPAKTRVIVNAWAIGRDPDTWTFPDCFWPERFAYHDADVHGSHFELIPFGVGRRMCPGLAFGLANVMHSLAVLLYHFDWELPRGVTPENFDMSETAGLKATRKNDLCLIAKLPYSSKQ